MGWQLDGRPTIVLYHSALEALGELANASIDAVVSVSALEHNRPADIVPILAELQRVTKPDGALYLTVSATRDQEQFHEPSHSCLLNESGLIRTYSLTNPRSNFCRYDAIAREFNTPRYLDRWLSWTYDDSLDNGMPGRVWAPAYLPVAILKRSVLARDT